METIRYMTSLLTFYLKGEIASEQNFIKFKNPNTILGLIPLGAKKESVPVNQISSTESNFKLILKKLIIGIIILFLAFSLFGQENGVFAGIILLIIAANTIIDAFEIDLVVKMTSGQEKIIDFFIFEKSKADKAAQNINAMIAGRLDDTNSRQQTDRVIDAMNNK